MKRMMREFLFVVLVVVLSVGTAGANTSTVSNCEQQLTPVTPATMANLRTLYNKSVSTSLTPEQRAMAASLYRQKLEAAAAAYSTTMKKLHDWVISQSTQGADNSSHTQSSSDRTLYRMIFYPRIKHILNIRGASVETIAFSPDGKKIISTSQNNSWPWIGATEQDAARVWDVATGQLLFALPQHPAARMISAKFSSDNSKIITTVIGGEHTHIWDATTGEQILHFEGTGSLSPDGTKIVITPFEYSSTNTSASIWDISTEMKVLTLTGHEKRVNSASYSADGTAVITTSHDNVVLIWDSTTGEKIRELARYSVFPNKASYSPDNTKIAAIVDSSIVKIWDAVDGREIHSLEGMSYPNKVNFSSDSSQVVIASLNAISQVFDIATGREVHQLVGHAYKTNSATYSADNTKIVTSSSDKTARIWDVKTGKEIYAFKEHTDRVNDAVFSPDSTQIITASRDGTIRVWDLYITEEEMISILDTGGHSP